MPGDMLQGPRSTGLPPLLLQLQNEIETRYIETCRLERELARLRAERPLLCMVPPRPNPVYRLLLRLVPPLRRRRALRVIRGSGLFDAAWYLSQNPDVARAGLDPARHYLAHGAADRRDPGPHFSTGHYLDLYPDIASGETNPLLHYLQAGWREQRSIRPDMPHGGPQA